MSQQAFERGDWQAVIDAHQLESHDPAEWLRYGAALLHTIEPGPEQGRQQQQAALAFVQAQKEGALADWVSAFLVLSIQLSLHEALTIAGVEGNQEEGLQSVRNRQAALGALQQINTHLRNHHWNQAIEALEALTEKDDRQHLSSQARSRILHALLQHVLGEQPNVEVSTYAELNAHRRADAPLPADAGDVFEASARLSPATPLILIQNADRARQQLTDTPFWIAYGNVRTGSTMVFNLLRILANSLTRSPMSAWVGDFASPEKFFEIIEESQGILSGVLKIHHNHKAVNQRLRIGQAKAVLTHRNMRDCCYSYWRMLGNRNSVFYQDNPSLSLLEKFITHEILAFQAKAKQPYTLLLQEERIRNDTEGSIQQICEFLGLSIHPESRLFLAQYLSPDRLAVLANTRADNKNSTGHESVTFLHPGHVATDASINYCSNEVRQEIERMLQESAQRSLDDSYHILPQDR
jgi:hypothetical protein